MNRISVIVAALFLLAQPVLGKPLLTNSEETYESACLANSDTPERLVEICEHALQTTGATAVQRIEMMETLAWAHHDAGDEEKAFEQFNVMLELDPVSAEAFNGLGWLAYGRDDYSEAASFFAQAMETKPEEQSLAGLGASLYRSGQLPLVEAVGYLDAALAITPTYAWAMRQKGWLYSIEDFHAEAIDAFEDALEINPDDVSANYGVGYVLTEEDKWVEALPYINRALQEAPDDVSSLSRRSLILLNLDRPAQALRDGERVVELTPDDSDGYVRVARAQVALGRAADALKTLAEAEEIVGYDNYLTYWYAEFLSDAGQVDEAMSRLEKVFERDDADYWDHELRSQILLNAERYGPARAALDESLLQYPDAPFLIFYDALVLIGEEKYTEAEARFDDAVAADLPPERLKYFLKQLVGAAQYLQAVQMRVRYTEQSE
ncbi:tetratricopeptide repeat protein [Shimia isoporae]|uniref:Tetratricopeptide repeat protein n=1 Tax=Shimia isoporae TaxID=647720 RepID=A0A4R1NK26_9RHOB|nr:tetratricopeptide repeat protein [Shimia isoporae]TCL07971.1 tetratricopeptide repeat protein [Shimia isoporae]